MIKNESELIPQNSNKIIPIIYICLFGWAKELFKPPLPHFTHWIQHLSQDKIEKLRESQRNLGNQLEHDIQLNHTPIKQLLSVFSDIGLRNTAIIDHHLTRNLEELNDIVAQLTVLESLPFNTNTDSNIYLNRDRERIQVGRFYARKKEIDYGGDGFGVMNLNGGDHNRAGVRNSDTLHELVHFLKNDPVAQKTAISFCPESFLHHDTLDDEKHLGTILAEHGFSFVHIRQTSDGNGFGIIIRNHKYLPSQTNIQLIPADGIVDFSKWNERENAIVCHTINSIQLMNPKNNDLFYVSGYHTPAPTSVYQRLISHIIEALLVKKQLTKYVLADRNSYGFDSNTSFYTLKTIPLGFLFPAIRILISQSLPFLSGYFNQTENENRLISEICQKVGVTYTVSQKPSFYAGKSGIVAGWYLDGVIHDKDIVTLQVDTNFTDHSAVTFRDSLDTST
jgi:hypothetical protein